MSCCFCVKMDTDLVADSRLALRRPTPGSVQETCLDKLSCFLVRPRELAVVTVPHSTA